MADVRNEQSNRGYPQCGLGPPYSASSRECSCSFPDASSPRCRSLRRRNRLSALAIQKVRMGLSPTITTVIHRTKAERSSTAPCPPRSKPQLCAEAVGNEA